MCDDPYKVPESEPDELTDDPYKAPDVKLPLIVGTIGLLFRFEHVISVAPGNHYPIFAAVLWFIAATLLSSFGASREYRCQTVFVLLAVESIIRLIQLVY